MAVVEGVTIDWTDPSRIEGSKLKTNWKSCHEHQTFAGEEGLEGQLPFEFHHSVTEGHYKPKSKYEISLEAARGKPGYVEIDEEEGQDDDDADDSGSGSESEEEAPPKKKSKSLHGSPKRRKYLKSTEATESSEEEEAAPPAKKSKNQGKSAKGKKLPKSKEIVDSSEDEEPAPPKKKAKKQDQSTKRKKQAKSKETVNSAEDEEAAPPKKKAKTQHRSDADAGAASKDGVDSSGVGSTVKKVDKGKDKAADQDARNSDIDLEKVHYEEGADSDHEVNRDEGIQSPRSDSNISSSKSSSDSSSSAVSVPPISTLDPPKKPAGIAGSKSKPGPAGAKHSRPGPAGIGSSKPKPGPAGLKPSHPAKAASSGADGSKSSGAAPAPSSGSEEPLSDADVWATEQYSAEPIDGSIYFFRPADNYIPPKPEKDSPAWALQAKDMIRFMQKLNFEPEFQEMLRYGDMVCFNYLFYFCKWLI